MDWYGIAEAEIGQAEIAGAGNNPRIVEYMAKAGFPQQPDATPWCAGFANFCLAEAGIEGTGSLAARSFLRWGRCRDATPRCIPCGASLTGDPNAGHVGFFVAMANDKVMVLGGNQGDKVSILPFPESMVLGYRWPEEAPLATSGHELHHAAHGALESRSWAYWARGHLSKLLGGAGLSGSLLSLASGLTPLDWVLIAVGAVFVAMVALQLLQLRDRNKQLGAKP